MTPLLSRAYSLRNVPYTKHRDLPPPLGPRSLSASRMESTGVPGCIQVSSDTFTLLQNDEQHLFEPRGAIEVKGKGELKTYLLQGSSSGGAGGASRAPAAAPA